MVKPLAELSAGIIEGLGVGLIGAFAVFALLSAAFRLLKRVEGGRVFRKLRRDLGRGILLGLEFLVAADIIHTVAVSLSFATVGVLAIVVLIRTFLSFTLEVELTGHWPWQRAEGAESPE